MAHIVCNLMLPNMKFSGIQISFQTEILTSIKKAKPTIHTRQYTDCRMVWYRSLSVQLSDIFSYDGFDSVSPLLVCVVSSRVDSVYGISLIFVITSGRTSLEKGEKSQLNWLIKQYRFPSLKNCILSGQGSYKRYHNIIQNDIKVRNLK